MRETTRQTWRDYTTNNRINLERLYNKQQDKLGEIIQQTTG